MKFTDTMVRNLKTDKKRYLREANGFTIRVMPSGVKTWLFVYTISDGKRKEMNLGNYPAITLAEAKQKYNDAYSMLQKGVDPGAFDQEEKETLKRTPIVSDLTDDYIEKYAKEHNRAWQVSAVLHPACQG